MSFEVTLKFLEAVQENNNTTRLHTYRDLYQNERQRFSDFIQEILNELKELNPAFEDLTSKDCIFRFNKDIRFSKDKHPYKDHFGAVIAEGGRKSELPCLYIHLQPGGNSMIAGGLYLPPREIMHKTRNNIAKHLKQRTSIICQPAFKKSFGTIQGKSLVQMPRGYDKDDKAAERFLYKSRHIGHSFTDKEVCAKTFKDQIISYYKIMKPFNDFLEAGVN